jgi:hypothetical protein
MTLAKHKIPEPHIKVKDAAEYFVNTPGATLAGAAKYTGLSVAKMRELLQMPHNLAHVRRVKALAVEALAVSCPAALGKIIKESSNAMATVAAAKTVLAQARESEQSRETAKPMPGLLIVIGGNGDRSISIEPQQRLAGARTVLKAGAYERGPDPDDDFLVDNSGAEAFDGLPEPAQARVAVRSPRRK